MTGSLFDPEFHNKMKSPDEIQRSREREKRFRKSGGTLPWEENEKNDSTTPTE